MNWRAVLTLGGAYLIASIGCGAWVYTVHYWKVYVPEQAKKNAKDDARLRHERELLAKERENIALQVRLAELNAQSAKDAKEAALVISRYLDWQKQERERWQN